MHDSAKAGLLGGLDQRHGVGHRLVKVDPAPGKPNPVGIVEDLGASETADQLGPVVEIEREDVDLISEAVGPVGVSGESPDRHPHGQQPLGDVLAGEAECPPLPRSTPLLPSLYPIARALHAVFNFVLPVCITGAPIKF